MAARYVKVGLSLILACCVVAAVVALVYGVRRSSSAAASGGTGTGTGTGAAGTGTAVVYRYYNSSTGMHQNTLSAAAPSSSWARDPCQFSVYTAQLAGTVPLYSLQNPANTSEFMTSIIPAEASWSTVGVLGYVWATPPTTASVQVYRMYSSSLGDHMSSLVNTEGAPRYAADGRTWWCPQPSLSIGRRLRSFLAV